MNTFPKSPYVLVLTVLFSTLVAFPAIASGNTLIAASPGAPSAAGAPVMTPRETGYPNVPQRYYGYNPGVYGNYPYANSYYQPYPAYGVYPNNPYAGNYNPYAPTYLGRYNVGGAIQPVYGPPQLINGNWYGINIGGSPYTYWQAPSGFYYPWSGGISYSDRPILTMSPNGTNPLRTQPPITTVISDLNSYLDRAKADGKISLDHYQDFQQRTKYLLKKEQSMAQRNEGVLDLDEEAELRKEVDNLSKEIAYRVQP